MISRIFRRMSAPRRKNRCRERAAESPGIKRVRANLRDTMVGMSSAFDLFQQPVRETHPWYWDAAAIRGDFETVGRDMERAMSMVEPPAPASRPRPSKASDHRVR